MAGAAAIQTTGTTADEAVTASQGFLMGFSLRESAASPAVATAIIRDGTTATDPVVVMLELNGDQSATMWFGPDGIRINTGVFLDRVAGTITGALYVR
jgi:hypothetical protein